MRGRSWLSVTLGAVVLLMVLLACKKKPPTQVLASCDLRGTTGGDTCYDVYDKGFVEAIRGICLSADSTGSHWHDGAACDTSGALGGCRSDTATTWHFPNDKETTPDDVKKACSPKEKFVEAIAVAGGSATASGAAPIAKSTAADPAALLGTKADGFMPKPFVALKHEMKPAEVAKIFPGADKTSYDAATIDVKDVPGVQKYVFRYVKNRLFEVEIWFAPSLHTKTFHDQLVKAANAKWGDTTGDSTKLDEMLFWHGEGMQSANLTDESGGLDSTGKYYKLTVEP